MELLGRRTRLVIKREAPPGVYLDAFSLGEVLLPRREVPEGARPGDEVEAFIYRDSEDRLVAAAAVPLIQVGEFGVLRVVGTHPAMGAFLDWGLAKDLLLPRREQGRPRRVGESVLVHVHIDEVSNRIVASTRLHRWTRPHPGSFAPEQPVGLLVAGETPLGYKVIVEKAWIGQIYRAEISRKLSEGEALTGYIRRVRPDGKLDVGLDRSGLGRLPPLGDFILQELARHGGSLPYHDGTSPEEIRAVFGVSKKAFKQALGLLYRQRKIDWAEGGGIRLV